jgi:hypothetical protein
MVKSYARYVRTKNGEQFVIRLRMSRGMDIDGGGEEASNSQDMSKRQGLIAVNDLLYVLEPDLSVASNKTHKNHFFQSAEYNYNHTAICILNSGADYIDTRRSWLQFDVEMTCTDDGSTIAGGTAPLPSSSVYSSFGAHGSACNLISSILISTRSGDELCHLNDFNLMQNMLIPLAYGREWMDGPGALMGAGGGIPNKNRDGNGNLTQRFCIPMYVLAPLFGYGRLMPSMLMSGMRIEITFAKPETAYQTVTCDRTVASDAGSHLVKPVERVSTYKVLAPQFVLASVQLSDSIQRALNELSATNGLEIVYTDYAQTPHAGGTSFDTVNVEVRKSCSRALKAFARIRNNGYNTQPFSSVDASYTVVNAAGDPVDQGGKGMESMHDSFRSEQEFPFHEYQWQLGSLYFPQQPVTGTHSNATIKAQQCAVSSYAHLLESVDKYSDNASIFNTFSGIPGGFHEVGDSYYSKASLLAYEKGSIGHGYGFNGQQTTIGVTLERSTMFNLAGVPVNNSRVLALRAKLNIANTETRPNVTPAILSTNNKRQLDIFLKYVKLARVFLNNVEVEQ